MWGNQRTCITLGSSSAVVAGGGSAGGMVLSVKFLRAAATERAREVTITEVPFIVSWMKSIIKDQLAR